MKSQSGYSAEYKRAKTQVRGLGRVEKCMKSQTGYSAEYKRPRSVRATRQYDVVDGRRTVIPVRGLGRV
jgi:hypothetical protein